MISKPLKQPMLYHNNPLLHGDLPPAETATSGTLQPVFAHPLERPVNRLAKRVLDIGISLAVLTFVMSWLTPLLALLIKLDSRGPVFFKQLRSGKNNQAFTCYKFRSMRVNAQAHTLQATQEDARLTRVGRFLRRTSLDELPQFFNVLCNHMSVAGPRPHMLLHTEQYGACIDNYMSRLLVKPGITGWAQVCGYRGETRYLFEMEQRVQHDLYYLQYWTPAFDRKIIWMTVKLLLRRTPGVY
ncbi:hypothetical protein DCC81_21385 [Chitinophaga parva]|uniref:Bacterial sugar transferase domain-containing protein n=1 Tax=Chitinophaga parva TaxID=2169414 RepID=A0A2T7BCY9_9BACT|nr:sugar transferase [Chitinophaga parva]PUZ22968.1 hypothetical protein DCC81_21385 [Chitinophaga parva]